MDKTCILRGHSNFDLYLQNLISLSLSSSGHWCQFEEIPLIFFWDFAFKRLGCHEVTVILTSHHQHWISSSLSRSERLRQIWRNSVKSFLKYHRPPESNSYRWLGGTRSLYQRHTELETWADDGNSSGVRHLFFFLISVKTCKCTWIGQPAWIRYWYRGWWQCYSGNAFIFFNFSLSFRFKADCMMFVWVWKSFAKVLFSTMIISLCPSRTL